MKKENSIKKNCFNVALQLMFKYNNPTGEQVYHHLCTQDHCPEGKCGYMFGFKEGRQCVHNGTVKKIINRIKSLRDGD